MMLRRLAFVSGLAVLSAVTLAPKAGAAPVNQDIIFNGTIGSVCTFTNPTDGTLAQIDATKDWIEASNGVGVGSVGVAGTVTLNCSAGGSLSVAAPIQQAAPAGFSPTITQALVENETNSTYTRAGGPFDNGLWSAGSTTALTIPANANQSLRVGMVTGKNTTTSTVVKPGTYTYKVTLTATPN